MEGVLFPMQLVIIIKSQEYAFIYLPFYLLIVRDAVRRACSRLLWTGLYISPLGHTHIFHIEITCTPGRLNFQNTKTKIHSFHQPAVLLLPGTNESILGVTLKHLTSVKTIHRSLLNPEPALILALTKIRSRIEVLACQKQAESSH
jgi:hypothetical protein